jgi:hypothetical protein
VVFSAGLRAANSGETKQSEAPQSMRAETGSLDIEGRVTGIRKDLELDDERDA